MSLQRKRGQYCKVWKSQIVRDSLGNEQVIADASGPHLVRAAFIPDRSARAEVPGQTQINIFTMLVAADLPDVTLYSRVEWRGSYWDVVSPPALHFGTRQTRHWTFSIRKRPGKLADNDDGTGGGA